MRNQPPYSCPQCGEPALPTARCWRCDVPMVDSQGRPVLVTPLRRFTLTDSSSFRGLLPPLNKLFIWLADRNRQSRAEERQREAGPVQSIGAASGRCHVRGRVHVLQPVELEPELRAGALLSRRRRGDSAKVEVVRDGRPVMTTVSRTYIEERTACGRFAVIDDTGVAIVDDDAFEVWSLGPPLGSTGDGMLAACDGDEVEILGPAEPGLAPEVRDIPAKIVKEAGYRDAAPRALLFDGKARDRVLILAPQH